MHYAEKAMVVLLLWLITAIEASAESTGVAFILKTYSGMGKCTVCGALF